jgi:riboflavin biosynthesis pyrimidine reductase
MPPTLHGLGRAAAAASSFLGSRHDPAYLRAGLIDEMHLAVRPVLLGSGESLFAGLDLRELGYQCTRHVAGERALHVVITRRA